MKAKGPYNVIRLDSDGYEISASECDTLAVARLTARMDVEERELIAGGLHKVEVRDVNNVCVFDRFAVRS